MNLINKYIKEVSFSKLTVEIDKYMFTANVIAAVIFLWAESMQQHNLCTVT